MRENCHMEQIVKYVDIGLIALFILLIIGLLLAALRGFLRGVWKSTHNMIFMLSLILIAFFTLNAFTDFVGSFPISNFMSGTITLSRTVDGQTMTYYVPVSNLKETLQEFIQGFYTLYNVSASSASATNFAIALTTSVMKVAIFIIDMILIVTLGNLLSFLSWYLIFRHFIPKAARKTVKLKWVGLAETAITYLVVTFLFLTPFTSILNSVNQSYQKAGTKNSDNEMMQNVGSFIDSYNNSIFAKVFFNWTVDKNGMTFDTRLFDSLTTGVSDGVSVGLVGEFANITNVIASAAGAVTTGEEGGTTFDFTALISKEVINNAFDAVLNSDLISNVFPIVIEIALNSDLLKDYIPGRLVDLSDVKWEEEIGYVRDMVDCVFDSGAVDSLFTVDENGKRVMRKLEGADLVSFIEEVVYSKNFDSLLEIFKSIDKSKVLSRAVPALLQFVKDSDKEGVAKQYLPLSWEELNELSWGYETYVLFDFLHSTVELDPDFMKAIFVQAGVIEADPSFKSLPQLIHEYADQFKELMVGKFDSHGELVNVDKYGQTLVYDKGQRVMDGDKPRHYCLFDMNLVGKIMPTILDQLFDLEAFKEFRAQMSEEDLQPFHQAVADLNNGVRLKNYKKEFNSILDVVATAAVDEELVEALLSGKGLTPLMEEENNFFSIKQYHITNFQNAIEKMDKTTVLYSALTPFLKTVFKLEDVYNTLNDIGLKSSVFISAIDHDMKSSEHKFFSDFSSLLDRWSDLNVIYSLQGADTNALMNKFKDVETKNAFVRVLDTLYKNPLINPTPNADDDYEKNENLYGLLEYIFNMTKDMGLTVTRQTLREVESAHSWSEEFEALGNIIHFIAIHDISNASSVFGEGKSFHDGLEKLYSEDDYDIPGLFKIVDESYIFKQSLGPFLDDSFGKDLTEFLIDKDGGVTFSNITDWKAESDNIKALLISLHNITENNDNILEKFDMTTLDNIVELNELLHNLANSGIFTYIDEHGVAHYQFGKWLYKKIDSSMQKFKVDNNEYDLLADPIFTIDNVAEWNDTNWGERPGDGINPDPYYQEWQDEFNADNSKTETHYIAYKDFVYPNGKPNTDSGIVSFWCDYDAFTEAQATFKDTYGSKLTTDYCNDNDWKKYYGSDSFAADYESVFSIDEISRVTRFMTYAMRILNKRADNTQINFDELPTSLLSGLLHSLNDTYCMRVGIYNFYRIASENVLNSYSGFSLNSAYTSYAIDADIGFDDFDHARPVRGEELDRLVSFYEFIYNAKQKGVISGGNFNFDKIENDATLVSSMKDAMIALNESYIFHRKGSDSKAEAMTTFQNLFDSILSDSDVKNSIYIGGDKSPKDAAAVDFSNGEEKIRYLVLDLFREDSRIPTAGFNAQRASQTAEVARLVDIINKLYSLEDKDGNVAKSITDADLNRAHNIDAIESLLDELNKSKLLYDLVPNSIYKLFIENHSLEIKNGSETIDFQQVDPFYHYYFDEETLEKRTAPDFTATYSNRDITGISNLITDYQNYNSVVPEGGKITNCVNLMSLTGSVDDLGVFHSGGALSSLLHDLHDCPIFHSPARNLGDGEYYDDKFDHDAYTLFEKMMDKICTFTDLHDFAYDSDYDYPTYANKEAKLTHHIKAITAADDSSTTPGICYHNDKGSAWNEEIDAIMEIAYRVAAASKDDANPNKEIDVNTFKLESLKPEDVKAVLTAINYSDLVGDAVPGFVKDGFGYVGLDAKTTYDTVNYSVYRLGQKAYGGEDLKGSEIENIYHLMVALRNDTDTGYVTNAGNITAFIEGPNGEARITGLMEFIYKSRILNTSQAGVYKGLNTVDGRSISAQGLLLYNSIDSNLQAYIARRANDPSLPKVTKDSLDKVATLTKILNMSNYQDENNKDITYQVEAKGLKALIGYVNTEGMSIEDNTFSSNDINAVKQRKETILNIVACSYNSTGETDSEQYKRSAIVSEFLSGLLNNIMENEYGKIYTNGYAFNVYSFGEDNYLDLDFNDYDSLNEIEKDGLEGMLDALDYITAGNIAFMKEHADDLSNCFEKMGREVGKNSHISQAIYLGEAHTAFKTISLMPIYDSGMNHFPVVDDATTSPTSPNNIYSNDFCFKDYGLGIKTFLDDVTL